MSHTRPDLYGLLGYPLGHTLSPAMHQAALAHFALSGTYLALPVPPERLAGAIAGVRAWRLPGLNVTVPHKQAVIQLLDETTPHARRLGAVNTLYWDGDRLCGDNTDYAGFLASLPTDLALAGATVTVLGAGGSARAVVAALADRGVGTIHLAARRPEQARALAEDLIPVAMRGWQVALEGDDRLTAALTASRLLVNTTPVGMAGSDLPMAESNLAALPADAFVYDLIYRPLETPLLAVSRARGLAAQNGLEMLVAQAAHAFERWTGHFPPLPLLRAAIAPAFERNSRP